MKKKLTFLLITAISATLLTACASKDTTGTTTENTTTVEIHESVTETETTESTSATPETNSTEEVTTIETTPEETTTIEMTPEETTTIEMTTEETTTIEMTTEETTTAETTSEVIETETSEPTTGDSSQTNNTICDSWTSPELMEGDFGHMEFHLVINSDLTYTCDDGDVSGTLVEVAPNEYMDESNGCIATYNPEYDCLLFGTDEYCIACYFRTSTLQ